MGYINYKNLKQVSKKFNLQTKKKRLLPNLEAVEPSDWLKKSIELAYNVALSNEKVKSERLISPILTEVHETFKDRLALFSGEELNVDPANDLSGACDFLFFNKTRILSFRSPHSDLSRGKR